jgi:ribosomal protein S21
MSLTVQRKSGENSISLINRFSKKIKRSRFLREVRAMNYHQRPKSDALKKRSALAKKAASKEYHRLRKLGKI